MRLAAFLGSCRLTRESLSSLLNDDALAEVLSKADDAAQAQGREPELAGERAAGALCAAVPSRRPAGAHEPCWRDGHQQQGRDVPAVILGRRRIIPSPIPWAAVDGSHSGYYSLDSPTHLRSYPTGAWIRFRRVRPAVPHKSRPLEASRKPFMLRVLLYDYMNRGMKPARWPSKFGTVDRSPKFGTVDRSPKFGTVDRSPLCSSVPEWR